MKHNQPKVTAVVPSYNHAPYIRERIESILGQTYDNIELIVIDDCSSDDSDAIITAIQKESNGFKYIRNKKNSGTPFSAWEKIGSLASGDFIWICESDDVAEPTFVETAINRFNAEPEAVLFYSSSLVIDKDSQQTGHTDNYFHDIWKETRWDNDFVADGLSELTDFQLRGQVVPNMSSSMIRIDAFKKAFSPFLKRLKLTGDWLFVGDVMQFGKVVFHHEALSRFREHEVTSRVRVKSARSQAEFILTKYRLFRSSKQPIAALALLMSSDVIRFLYEPASWLDVVKALFQVSWYDSCKFGFLLLLSTSKNKALIQQFKERYKHAKSL